MTAGPQQQKAHPTEEQEVAEQKTAEEKEVGEKNLYDLTLSIMALTKALESLLAVTLDLAIRQLLKERESRLEKGAKARKRRKRRARRKKVGGSEEK